MIVLTEGFLWLIRFMIGACIFSFLNVVADRLPREESVVRGRSHCMWADPWSSGTDSLCKLSGFEGKV